MNYLADTLIQSALQLTIGDNPPWSYVGLGLVQGPNSFVDLILATPGLEPATFQIPVMYLSH